MPGLCFIDTNVLIYAATAKADEPMKHAVADRLIQTERFVVSAQVLQEFYVASQKARPTPLSPDTAGEWVGWLAPFCEVATDGALVQRAIALSTRYDTSYWDGAILAAAERAGADTLYSEDLSHGQAYGAVRVLNPFRPI